MANYKDILGKKIKEGMSAEEILELLDNVDLGNPADGSYIGKEEYAAMNGEIAKLQKEIRSYKDKEKESLSADERTKYELQKLTEDLEAQKQELSKYKLKEQIIKSGFSTEECEQIMAAQEKGENLAGVYASIMKERTEAAVKSAQAEMIKAGTPPAPNGSDDILAAGKDKSPDVALAEELARENLTDTQGIDSIKSSYLDTGEFS